jgi:hypothetical protein
MVVPTGLETGVDEFDFSVLSGLTLVLHAAQSDPVVARDAAAAMCKGGAALVVLLHPSLSKNSEFFYGARR